LNSRSRPSFSAAIIIALGIGLAAVLSSQPSAPALTLLAKDGRRSVPLTLSGDQELVALDDLAQAFQLSVQESLGAITVSYKSRTIVLTPDQTLASVAGRLISLPAPPTRSGRRWLVPVEFISRALAPIFDARLDLRKPSRLLIVGDLRVPRVVVRYDTLGASGRLTIDATPRAQSAVTQENDRLIVRFEADALDAAAPLLPTLTPQSPSNLIQNVRLSDATSISVDLGPRFGGFKATSQPVDTTMRLVIDLAAAQTETPAPAQPPAPPPAELPPAFGQTGFTLRTVAIDPGHGGDDEGAKGAEGAKEKDVALSVARRAKAVIETRLGVRVLLTRDDDRRVPLDERTAMANNNKADLFISLHASASPQPTAFGASIFFAEFTGEAAQTAGGARAERVPVYGGVTRDIELVPWGLAQTRHLEQSSAFADILVQQLRDQVPLGGHPIDHAPLRVLESANMPAVLVELGYLTNPDQEKRLTGEAFQGTFVQALYEAIVRFRDSLAGGGGQ
jgi:N-acetylmuramoyl-L-alanine amidase